MYRFFIILFTWMALFFSCKKTEPNEVINKDNTTNSCSTCVSHFINVTNNDTIVNKLVKQTSFTSIIPVVITQICDLKKTNTGFFYCKGLALEFNTSNFNFSSNPSYVTFTHARQVNQGLADSSVINIKINSHPLIVCKAHEVSAYLASIGYQAKHYSYNTYIQKDVNQFITTNCTADSIVIYGEINSIIVGANLKNSELRNICFGFN